nr:hypothetical protein BaRGS_034642 [Batillaria attramentaria]
MAARDLKGDKHTSLASSSTTTGQTMVDKHGVVSGVGINSSTIPDLYNFFIGLDNLHRLLQQSTYQTNILFEFNSRTATSVNCYYDFKVGSETTAYSLTYAYYAPSFGPADEGFSLANPVIFSTSDNDPNGCVASKGAPGWYGADCVGPALFRSCQTAIHRDTLARGKSYIPLACLFSLVQ